MVSATKNPAKVRAGAMGGQARWAGHAPAVVRLDDLSAPQRRLVLALVDAARKETVDAGEMPSTVDGGGTRDADS